MSRVCSRLPAARRAIHPSLTRDSLRSRESPIVFRRLAESLLLHVSGMFPGKPGGDLLDIFLCDLLGFLHFSEDSELRTDQSTKAAVYAVISLEGQFRGVVALFVEGPAFPEAAVRAKFDTEAASLAAPCDYLDRPAGNGMRFGIQRQTPKLHNPLTVLLVLNCDSISHFFAESIGGGDGNMFRGKGLFINIFRSLRPPRRKWENWA